MTYKRYEHRAPADGAADLGQIQSEIEEIRGEIDHTLDDISAKLEPKELLAQALQSLQEGGAGRFVRNAARSIEDNPIPLAMIAGGFGYMMYQDAQRRKYGDSHDDDGWQGHPHEGYAPSSAGDPDDDAQSGLERQARQALGNAKQGAESMLESARGGMSHAREGMSGAARRTREGAERVADSASRTAQRARQATRRAAQQGESLLRERPLVLAGLGIAFGATMAGSLPMSGRERQALREPGREVIDRAEGLAREKKEQLTRAAQAARSGGEAREQAEREHSATVDRNEPS